MKAGFIKYALLLRRNVIMLITSLIVLNIGFQRIITYRMLSALGIGNFPRSTAALWLSLAIYGGFVIQSILSNQAKEDFAHKEMINDIRRTHEDCRLKARNLKRKLEPKAQLRLDGILKEAEEIVHSFLNGDTNPLKERVVQQSLKLTTNYIRLADMFRVRATASGGERISALAKRINANTSNLNSVRDPGIASELRRVIEADERMIESLKNERLELEKIDARLQYMESTISMLKYNIISNLESEDILSSLESDVSEAGALNTVLADRFDERREERRLRL